MTAIQDLVLTFCLTMHYACASTVYPQDIVEPAGLKYT